MALLEPVQFSYYIKDLTVTSLIVFPSVLKHNTHIMRAMFKINNDKKKKKKQRKEKWSTAKKKVHIAVLQEPMVKELQIQCIIL